MAPCTLVLKVMGHATHEFYLFRSGQACNSQFHHLTVVDVVQSNESMVVDVCEESHDKLAIHTIGHAAVSWDGVAKVLDLEGSLQPRREETSEGRDERSEGSDDNSVDLHGFHGEREKLLVAIREEEEVCGGLERVRLEDRVRFALEAGENVGPKIGNGADEVLGAHEEVGQAKGENDRHDPGADKTLHRLLRRQFDQLRATESDTADVGEDIVGDDERRGEEEPDHALEDVVHDEVGLDNNEVQSHVRPRKVGELELEVAGLETCDEEDEANDVENKADEAVVGRKRQQDSVDQNDMLEVVNDALAIEEVHGSRQPVPVECLGGHDVACSRGHRGNGDDLLEGHDLDRRDTSNDVDVAHEQGTEEAADHDKGPERPHQEVGLLLFVVRGLKRLLGLVLRLGSGFRFVNLSKLRLRGRHPFPDGRARAVLAAFAEARAAAVCIAIAMGELDPSTRFRHGDFSVWGKVAPRRGRIRLAGGNAELVVSFQSHWRLRLVPAAAFTC